MGEVEVIGGQIQQEHMTKEIFVNMPRVYDLMKGAMWLIMLQEGKKPTRWLKPTSKGTRITFKKFDSVEEFEQEVKEAKKFIEYIKSLEGINYDTKRTD